MRGKVAARRLQNPFALRFPSCVLAALFLACGQPPVTSPPPASETRAPRPAPPPAPSPPQEIYIDDVVAGNPLVVRGRARTFENSVVFRLRDAKGGLILETYTTSRGEIGHHNLYEARIWVVRDPGPRLTVEAFEYSAKDGSVRSLTRRSIDYPVERIRAVLLFPTNDCETVKPFERAIPKSTAMARLLVEALVAGPTSSERAAGASPPFPSGSEVRGVNLRDGVLTVDFNERLRNVGGACAARAIRRSVTGTLERLPAVERVVITAAGREDLALQP